MNFANWKTTAAGFASGIAYAVTNQPDWKHIIVAVLMALTGLAAKDFNVTGGTTPNATNNPVVVAKTAQK